jgi:hypothetical protein
MRRNAADENELAVDIPVEGSAVIRLYSEYFTKTLGLPFYVQFDDTYFPRAPKEI